MMLDRIRQFVKHRTPVPRWIERSKKLILPGFDGMPLYDVLAFFIQGLRKGALTMRASSLAFKFFLALFPAIIFVFTLIPYIPIDQFQDQLLLQLESILPTEAYVLTKSTIEDLINRERSGLLSFGFILTLYFASNGMNAMISAFNQSYHTSEKRSVFRQRLVSLLLIGILTLLVLVSVVLIIFSKFVIGYL
ncbi:MAG: YhjD/YihY/BrkB family envelope integrity protein, partial [Bacteroidota bacterium]